MKIRSTKFEYRNPKQIQMTKTNAMFQTTPIRIPSFGFSLFWIYFAPLCFEFRASDFGFDLVVLFQSAGPLSVFEFA